MKREEISQCAMETRAQLHEDQCMMDILKEIEENSVHDSKEMPLLLTPTLSKPVCKKMQSFRNIFHLKLIQ